MGALTIPGRIQDALAFQQSQLGQADPLQGDNNGIPVTPPPVIPQAVPPPTPQAAPAQKKRSLMGRIFGGQDVTASGVGVDAQGNPIPVTGHSSIPGFLSVFPAIRAVAQRSAQQQIQPQEAALAAQQMKAAQAQARAKADLEESDAMKSRIFKGPDGLHIFDPQTNTLKPFMLYKDYQDSNTKAMVEMMMGKPGSDGSDSAIPNLNPIEKGKLLLAVQQASVTQDPDEAHKILFGAAQGILDDRNKSKDIPLGPKIALFQKRLDDQFSVAFPGKPTPQQYVLPPNATEKDFNLADASLKTFVASSDLQQNRLAARQQASATFAAAQAQRAVTNEMARSRMQMAQTAAEERLDKLGMTVVRGTDPGTGRPVSAPMTQAKTLGLQNLSLVPVQEVRTIEDARQVVNLYDKRGDKPEEMGILQLIDGLKKDGKLGVMTSRWNKFMTQGVGASPDDDPRIITLLDKLPLAMTLTMKTHFGASGGRSPLMLQHFLDLANAGKMDAETLTGGAKAVRDYMSDRAEMPGQTKRTIPGGSQKIYRAINPDTGQVHEGTTPPPANWKRVQ